MDEKSSPLGLLWRQISASEGHEGSGEEQGLALVLELLVGP